MKQSIFAGAKRHSEQYQRREALLDRADSAPLPQHPGELPREDYEKDLIARDEAADRARREAQRS